MMFLFRTVLLLSTVLLHSCVAHLIPDASEDQYLRLRQRKLQSTESSIAAIAVENSSLFSTLVTALQAAGLVDALSCTSHCQHFTVFAPTNAAFAELDGATNGLVEELVDNSEYRHHLRSVLFYHLVRGVVRSNQITNGAEVPTVLRSTITTQTNPIRINDNAQVIDPFDVAASNGIIHTIDQVLLPPFITTTTPQVAADAGIFTTLLAAADVAGLVDTLTSTRAYTLFAPTDDAFAALGQDTIDALLADPAQLRDILLYHVVPDAIVFSSELTDGATVPTLLSGSTITINEVRRYSAWSWSSWSWRHIPSYTLNDGVEIIRDDILSQNGVIHAIDRVLLPPSTASTLQPTIAEVVSGDDNFSTLLTALSTAGLVGLFDEAADGPFTVFAPTDDAFASLGQATIQSLLNDPERLAEILQYHVVAGTVAASDLSDGRVPTALADQEIDVDVRSHGTVVLNGNTVVTKTDIRASNGIVHVIDRVLIPPGNIVETAQGNAEFSTLVDLVVLADLAGALSAEGSDLTVFAPTDEAFAKLPASLVATLTDPANVELLRTVLTYHVVPAYAPLRSVQRGSLPTLQGETIHAGFRSSWHNYVPTWGVVLNGSSDVVQTDVFASNGVIHAIDEVLIPPSVAAGL